MEEITVGESKEKTGVIFQVLTGKSEPEHFHMEIELLYVLAGTVHVYLPEEKYTLSKGKVILINTNKKHHYSVEENTLLCKVSIDYFMLVKALKRDFIMFWCNSAINEDKDYAELCNILNQMLREYAVCREEESFMMKSLSYCMLESLTKNFLVQSEGTWTDNEDEKTARILQYINNHYGRAITLSELANQFYMSDSSFSRYFKKLMGVNFVEYVNHIRMNYAIEDILYTNKSITNIALDCGFSNPSAFNKIFKEIYQMSPTSYKKLMRNRIMRKEDLETRKCEEQLEAYLREQTVTEETNQKERKHIVVDAADFKEFSLEEMNCINAGLASDLLMGKLREQILDIKDALRLQYIRICNVFHPSLHICEQSSLGQYNFDKLDSVLDFIVENGMIPVLDLGTKPKRAALGVGKDLIIGNAQESRSFQDIGEWKEMLAEFIRHIVRRYEEEEISGWLLEFWYDEQYLIFDEETEANYYMEYYKAAWDTVKSICPQIRIGGNGLGVVYNKKKLQEHLEFWKESSCEPDFLTTYIYPYSKQGPEKEIYAKRMTDWQFAPKMLEDYERFLKELHYPQKDVYITEWNTSISERNYYNDSCAKAAHVAHQLIQLAGKTKLLAYFQVSDLLAQYYDVKEPLVGATGLLTRDGIPKPVFYTYLFMGRLGSNLVARGEQYLVTTNGKNKYYILLCNPKRFNHTYYLKAENEITVDDLEDIFENYEPLTLEFELSNVKNGSYHIKKHILNEEYGSILNEWKNLGYVGEVNKEDIDYLKTICRPHIYRCTAEVTNESLAISVELKAHEVMLLTITG
ncbi:GH39 family glycosyl hydrolase [Konateibacter massiliensis]|uniref:GH39 family glycosyl hydrolase n=1 Tax=Konateibacter massiliensis TaxID=2002841 RepID=UPI000C148772|nr:helix-turn-helix domain-containing protein [Konateibacter massiliensis]